MRRANSLFNMEAENSLFNFQNLGNTFKTEAAIYHASSGACQTSSHSKMPDNDQNKNAEGSVAPHTNSRKLNRAIAGGTIPAAYIGLASTFAANPIWYSSYARAVTNYSSLVAPSQISGTG